MISDVPTPEGGMNFTVVSFIVCFLLKGNSVMCIQTKDDSTVI